MRRLLRLVGVVVIALGLSGCQRGEELQGDLGLDGQVEERINQYLETHEITLPEDGVRIDLVDVSGGNASGVAVVQETETRGRYTVLADLPDLDEGWYEVYLLDEEGEALSLGRMTEGKGGYVLETSRDGLGGMVRLTVTRQVTPGYAPELVVLEGSR